MNDEVVLRVAGLRDTVRSFAREAEAMQRVRHPAIVEVLASGEDQGVPFLVVEFLAGGTLADRLKRDRLPVAEALDLGLRVGLQTLLPESRVVRSPWPSSARLGCRVSVDVRRFSVQPDGRVVLEGDLTVPARASAGRCGGRSQRDRQGVWR